MEFVEYKPEWLEILRAQDEVLRMEAITSDAALRLGQICVRLAKERYEGPVAIRVMTNAQTTFSLLMDGTDSYNEWWMQKKLNVSRASGLSSLRTLVEIATGARPMEPEFENERNYALCGGCMPLRNAAGRQIGYLMTSGLKHQHDHQLAADALAELLGVEIPRIAD